MKISSEIEVFKRKLENFKRKLEIFKRSSEIVFFFQDLGPLCFLCTLARKRPQNVEKIARLLVRKMLAPIKVKSALPPPPTQNPPPLQNNEFYGHEFFLQKERFFPGVHKIGAPISGRAQNCGHEFYGHEDFLVLVGEKNAESCHVSGCHGFFRSSRKDGPSDSGVQELRNARPATGNQNPEPRNSLRKKLKNYLPGPDPKLPKKNSKNTKNTVFLVFFEHFLRNLGSRPGG